MRDPNPSEGRARRFVSDEGEDYDQEFVRKLANGRYDGQLCVPSIAVLILDVIGHHLPNETITKSNSEYDSSDSSI